MASKSTKRTINSPFEEETTPVGKKSRQQKPRSEPLRTRAKSFFSLERRQLAEILVADEDGDYESAIVSDNSEAEEVGIMANSSKPPTTDEFRAILQEGLSTVAKKEDLDQLMLTVDRNANAINTINSGISDLENPFRQASGG